MAGVLLGAYVVLLVMLAEGMARTLLHPESLRSQRAFFTRQMGITPTRMRQRFCFAEGVASLRPGGLRAVHDDVADALPCPGLASITV
jgi:hypothetical protein